MPPRFISADSYGGWESANQGYDQQRDARYFNSLAVADRRRQMAAQEAAQAAAQEDAREAREMNWFLNREQMAQRASEFGAGSGQWERDFGLRSRIADESVAERAARNAEVMADREAQRTYSYDALRSGERQSDASLGVQREHYRALREGAVEGDQAQTWKAVMDVTEKGMVWSSPDEVMARFPVTRAQAQAVFDLSQTVPRAQAEDLLIAQALSKATKRKDQLPEMIKSTKEALPPYSNWIANLDSVAHRVLPGKSVRSRLGQQLRDFAAEDSQLDSDINKLQLRLDYPQPPRMNPAANALPVPRTIIPVSAGTTNAPAAVPVRTTNAYIPGRVYGGMLFRGGNANDPANWERAR